MRYDFSPAAPQTLTAVDRALESRGVSLDDRVYIMHRARRVAHCMGVLRFCREPVTAEDVQVLRDWADTLN